jgi:hypothetical protein
MYNKPSNIAGQFDNLFLFFIAANQDLTIDDVPKQDDAFLFSYKYADEVEIIAN